MNPDLINQLGSQLGVNGLPYAIPIHPNLVHMTLGLFIVAIGFDFVGVFFVLEKDAKHVSKQVGSKLADAEWLIPRFSSLLI